MAPIYTVTVPALSRLQNEPDRYRNAFVQVFEGLAIASFLLAGLLFPLSDALVNVILGNKWDAAAPIFAAMTPAFVHLPLATATSWLYTSQGRGRDLLVTACVGSAVLVGAFVAGLSFGAIGVAIAYSASSLLVILPLTFYVAGRAGPVTTRDLWVTAAAHLPVFFTVLWATWLAREWTAPSLSPLAQILVCMSVGGVAGVLAVCVFGRSRRAAARFVARLREFWKRQDT
jgi:PST family polysaccharide transporter